MPIARTLLRAGHILTAMRDRVVIAIIVIEAIVVGLLIVALWSL